MRTTVDLPGDLLRAAKVQAAQRGESLKDLFIRAITYEVEVARPARRGRVEFPLIRSRSGRRVDITNAEIEDIFAAEDAERFGG